MKNIIIILGTILLGTLIVNNLVLGERDSLLSASKDVVKAGTSAIVSSANFGSYVSGGSAGENPSGETK